MIRFKDVPILPDNHDIALKRLTKIQSRFRGDEKYFADYSSFMDKIIKNGHAEKVPESELQVKPGHKWYLPHHGVYHPKKPSKIRVVFDGSAQYHRHSLNSHLLQGPELTNTLLGVLLPFRKEAIAISCDVEQMFHQFRVNPKHRDYLCFLWSQYGELTEF